MREIITKTAFCKCHYQSDEKMLKILQCIESYIILSLILWCVFVQCTVLKWDLSFAVPSLNAKLANLSTVMSRCNGLGSGSEVPSRRIRLLYMFWVNGGNQSTQRNGSRHGEHANPIQVHMVQDDGNLNNLTLII